MSILAKDPLNIIVCGVGGQGNILASELLASGLVEHGFYTTVGETYGASQRGGPVMSHVRVSARKQYGPLISKQGADIIAGFEPVETLRVVREYGHKGTRIILNPRPVYPLGVLIGEADYPPAADIIKELSALCGQVDIVEATNLAMEAGHVQAANIVLLGCLAALPSIPLTLGDFDIILGQRFQGEILQLNRQAFKLGYETMLTAT
jgi:indolepyruvate ferredoxin oxidoreductase beta subunit